jgi:hypothetical protein
LLTRDAPRHQLHLSPAYSFATGGGSSIRWELAAEPVLSNDSLDNTAPPGPSVAWASGQQVKVTDTRGRSRSALRTRARRESGSSTRFEELVLQQLRLQPSDIGHHIAACPADSCLWLVLLPGFASMFDCSYSFLDQMKAERWREGCSSSSLCDAISRFLGVLHHQQQPPQGAAVPFWEEQRLQRWLLGLAPGLPGLVLLLTGWEGRGVWGKPAWPGLKTRLSEAAQQAMQVRARGRGGQRGGLFVSIWKVPISVHF